MLKCASIFTYEIDEMEVALEELQKQLDEKITLLDNTVGIILCHPEFISSGTLRYLCDNLPFDIAGATTSAQAVNNETGTLMLTLFIMTSDDTRFKTGVTGILDENIKETVKEAYENASKGENGQPRLALLFPPNLYKSSGDDFVKAWHDCIPATPIFGTLAMDDTPSFVEESETIYNGETYERAIPFILCYGKINPRFVIGTLPEEKAMPYRGEITKANGPFVHEINGMSTYRYFESIGFESEGTSKVNYFFMPFAIDQKARPDYDGVPVIRVLDSYVEDGSALFHGNVDEGSEFTLIKSEPADVLATTKEKAEYINNLPDVNGVLLFSCIIRRLVTMNNNTDEEFEMVKNTLRPDIPFMMGCAGGEICPTLTKNDSPTNRYHNYSLVILIV